MSTHSFRGSALDGLIRATEQNDLLLYLTAAVGVFMPGCVYMFYQYAHKLYAEYAKKRDSRKREEELERTAVTIFYAEGREHTEELAHQISARLDYEGPPVVNLADIDTAAFIEYKGIGLFVMDCTIAGREPENVEWFLEFLEDLAFDQKSTNLPCRQMHYAVVGIGDPRNGHARYNRAAKALARRLNSLGAVALCPLYYIYSHSTAGLEKQADIWASHIAETLNKFAAKIRKCPRSFWYYDPSDSSSSSYNTDDDEQEYSPDQIEFIYGSEDDGDDEIDGCGDEQLTRENEDDNLANTTDELRNITEDGNEM